MSEHCPGRAVLDEDGAWHIYCICGDDWCAEDWDYSAEYILHGPAEAILAFRAATSVQE